MTPIQQLMLGVGASKKTYMDDVFSTYLYTGSGSARQIVNGIDLSGEGGLVWIKNRDASDKHILGDTVRGVNKYLSSNSTAAETNDGSMIQASNSNGFNVGAEYEVNTNGEDYSSWSFRKAKGFFDVVTYNGSSGTSDISHNLGCIPGLIILKITNGTGGWWVYHRDLPATTNAAWSKVLRLDSSGAEQDAYNLGTASYHTATTFRVGNDNSSNTTGNSYIAYLFAGGESTADTARSVAFDGDTDELVLGNTNDFDFGANDFTIECWVKPNSIAYTSYYKRIWSFGSADNNSMTLNVTDNGTVEFRINNSQQISTDTNSLQIGGWSHLALVRHSNKIKLYLNGIQVGSTYSYTSTIDWSQSGEDLYIGTQIGNDSSSWNGKISNFRVVKGTAVYTTAFLPSTTPLTNISNTVLLCCNNSSITDATVKPGAISSAGNPTASIDSPFDDPAAFTFGDAGDQNVIKCGSYVGNGSSTGPEINLGWEPQWLLIKSASSNDSWLLLDAMRGVVTGGNEASLEPNLSDAEYNSSDWIEFTSTGWKIKGTHDILNGSGNTYIFTAIRRSDGYVGKPPDAGTDVFAIDTGNGSSTIPVFDSGFPVDMALYKYRVTGTADWVQTSRLQGIKRLITNNNSAEGSFNDFTWDSNVGWCKESSAGSGYYSWMWKRHAGFDVVTYTGNGTSGRQIPHSLSKIPEMIWAKRRNNTQDWMVYHKGLNGGSDPADKYLVLNTTGAEADDQNVWQDTIPNATHFTVGNDQAINNDNDTYIAMLFASVDGISSVGSYSGSNSTVTVTTGFQPRFLIIKSTSSASNYNWFTWDTVRGWGSGNDYHMSLNKENAQSALDMGAPTSTGFTVNNVGGLNSSGQTFIYYAHA